MNRPFGLVTRTMGVTFITLAVIPARARPELRLYSGTQFDPDCVTAFVEAIRRPVAAAEDDQATPRAITA